MSWNDPCLKCGQPRHGCECKIEYKAPTEKELIEIDEENERQKTICSQIGHDWTYSFIVYYCKRCGETSDY